MIKMEYRIQDDNYNSLLIYSFENECVIEIDNGKFAALTYIQLISLITELQKIALELK